MRRGVFGACRLQHPLATRPSPPPLELLLLHLGEPNDNMASTKKVETRYGASGKNPGMSHNIVIHAQRFSSPQGGRRVHFEEVSSAQPTETSPHTHTDAVPQDSPSVAMRVQALLCGVLIVIVAGAWFGRFMRSIRPTEEVSPAVKAYIDRTINRALRDPVGRRDFALHANGGRVIPDLTVVLSPGEQHAPGTILETAQLSIMDDSRIGQCWSFPGNAAQLGLRLSDLVHPTHVSIDHIPAEIAAHIDEAPRAMVLWGAIDGSLNESYLLNVTEGMETSVPGLRGRSQPSLTCEHTYVPLAFLEYDIRSSSHVQTFKVRQQVIDAGVYTGVIVLEILGNWGGSATCLYRVRIHGEPRVV